MTPSPATGTSDSAFMRFADAAGMRALILVVERDPHVRALERYFLEEAGFAVQFEEDGQQAIELAHELPLDRLVELVVINRALAAATDSEALVRQVVERTAEVLEADTAVLVVADEHGKATIPASMGLDPGAAATFDAPFDERVALKICRAIGCTAERFLAAPVMEGGAVRGMLAVFRREAPSREEESSLLSALADQVAIALGNAMHTRRLEQALAALREADRRKDEFLGMLPTRSRSASRPNRSPPC